MLYKFLILLDVGLSSFLKILVTDLTKLILLYCLSLIFRNLLILLQVLLCHLEITLTMEIK